jgi:hypothetical protein
VFVFHRVFDELGVEVARGLVKPKPKRPSQDDDVIRPLLSA